jgi:hypothetical protein
MLMLPPKVTRALVWIAAFALPLGFVRAAEISASVDPGKGVIEWNFGARKLLTYVFATNQFKPYVRELYTLTGENVLRDAPADHLHHHGLMYAIRVNGVNFWEERDAPGHERPIKLVEHKTGKSAGGLPQVSFTQLIHWVRGGDQQLADTAPVALLVERRTLTLTVDEARNEVALRWQAEFEPGTAIERVTLTGSEYNGLGLRLPEAWDLVARHSNSEQAAYPAEKRTHVTPARWAAVSHRSHERPVTVALFGHPSNHGATRFFSMVKPFTYLAATQDLFTVPLEYERGQTFRVDHLVLVLPGEPSATDLEKRYARWLAESSAR